jgi:transcription elongation factor/antiterminator RfaH
VDVKSDPDREQAWYLVHTHSGKEKLVVSHLERQGYCVFLPLHTKKVKAGRATKEVTAALFPAYLFVSFDRAIQNWRPINGTFGVKQLVCFNQMPAQVPSGIMEALFARLEASGLIQASPALHAGDRVRIADGPFTGQIAKIEALPSRERARLLLDIMSQWVPIEIDQTSLELA